MVVGMNGQSHVEERSVLSLLLSPSKIFFTQPYLTEICQKHVWWDPRLQAALVQGNYIKNEEVTLSCNNGFQPSFTRVKCAGGAQPLSYFGSPNKRCVSGEEKR